MLQSAPSPSPTYLSGHCGTCPLFRGLIFSGASFMNRFVLMVDAGYLLSQAIQIVSNRASRKRADLAILDPAALIEALISKSRSLLELRDKELLRVYWYDGMMANGLTAQQRAMVDVDDVQLRAGTINSAGQQKGVDSLIVTDLIELTSHHAICDAILITGDSDLAVGIELAQRRGVRIAVLGIEDLSVGVAHHQSFEITSRADRVGRLGRADIAAAIRYAPAPRPAAPAAVNPTQAPTPPSGPLQRPQTAAAPGTVATVAPAAPGTLATSAPAAPAASPAAQASPAAPVWLLSRSLTATDEALIDAAVRSFATLHGPTGTAVDTVTNRIEASVDKALIHHVFDELARGKLTNAEKNRARATFRKLP